MKKLFKGIGLLAASVLVVGALVSVPSSRAHADTPLMSLDSTSEAATLVSQSTITGGDAVTTWVTAAGDTVTAAGPVGAILDIAQAAYPCPCPKSVSYPPGTDVSIALPDTSDTTITGDQAIAQAASGSSLYQDALAVGISPTDAQQMVNNQQSTSGGIIGHVCVWWSKSVSGGAGHAYGCVLQRLLQSSGTTNWYIGNTVYASAWSDGALQLVGFRAYDQYRYANKLVGWSPQSTINTSCRDITLTAGYGGLSASETEHVCSGRLSPVYPTAGFGTIWGGSTCPGTVEGAPSASIENVPGGATGKTVWLHLALWGWLVC